MPPKRVKSSSGVKSKKGISTRSDAKRGAPTEAATVNTFALVPVAEANIEILVNDEGSSANSSDCSTGSVISHSDPIQNSVNLTYN